MQGDNADKIQAVINTLKNLNIPATYENVRRMTGIYETLAEVRDSLNEEKKDGEADPE